MDGFVRFMKTLPSRFLWLAVLAPILGVSGWSAYFIGRYLGMPPLIAGSVSACLDGTALLSADYSVRYAQAGMSSTGPKFVVWLFAGVSAFIQTRHALIGNELPGSWVLWAALPVAAATVFELHLRWARRKAKARLGAAYPKPLPSFGFVTWVYYPISTHFKLREVVGVRRDALIEAAKPQNPNQTDGYAEESEPESELALVGGGSESDRTTQKTVPHSRTQTGGGHAPVTHIRTWAKKKGYKVGSGGPIPRRIREEYHREQQERSGT